MSDPRLTYDAAMAMRREADEAREEFAAASAEQLYAALFYVAQPRRDFSEVKVAVLLAEANNRLHQLEGCDDAIYKMDARLCPRCSLIQEGSECAADSTALVRLEWRSYCAHLEGVAESQRELLTQFNAEIERCYEVIASHEEEEDD